MGKTNPLIEHCFHTLKHMRVVKESIIDLFMSYKIWVLVEQYGHVIQFDPYHIIASKTKLGLGKMVVLYLI